MKAFAGALYIALVHEEEEEERLAAMSSESDSDYDEPRSPSMKKRRVEQPVDLERSKLIKEAGELFKELSEEKQDTWSILGAHIADIGRRLSRESPALAKAFQESLYALIAEFEDEFYNATVNSAVTKNAVLDSAPTNAASPHSVHDDAAA